MLDENDVERSICGIDRVSSWYRLIIPVIKEDWEEDEQNDTDAGQE